MKRDNRCEIVLNKMFCGSYLDQNIGHEIINMYKDDHGDNYIYIQPYGTYSASHYGTIKHVLLTRSIEGRYALEVLGVALIDNDIYNPNDSRDKTLRTQGKICDSVCYGGESLSRIFASNDQNERQDVSVTMHAQHVFRPKSKVYLSFKDKSSGYNDLHSVAPCDAVIVNMESNYAKSSMKQYFAPGNTDYIRLQELIGKADLWTIDTQGVSNIGDLGDEDEANFFDICRIDDYELAFSNALAHFMGKYPELVVEFAREVLGIDTKPYPHIYRERENVDLYLENDDTVVVVENKITSKINGIIVSDNKNVGNQLKKYYDYATSQACGRKVRCYLLTPDYNRINLDDYTMPGF